MVPKSPLLRRALSGTARVKFAQAAAQQAGQVEVERCRQAQATTKAERLAEHSSEVSAEPPRASCGSTEEERRLEFGAHLVAQMTAQSQEQQDDLAYKVLNAQTESARMQIGRVDSDCVRQEVDDELIRISAVNRKVASSSTEALRASREATASMGRKVEGVEDRLREQVSRLERVLEESIMQQTAQADTLTSWIEAWMRSQSGQQVAMLQESKAFAEHKAQATSEATQNVLLKAVTDTELKLQAFQLEVTQQMELAEAQRAVRGSAKELAQQEAARQATAWKDEQQVAAQQVAALQEAATQAALQQAATLAQQAAAQQAAGQQAAVVAAQEAAMQQAAAQQAASQQAANQQYSNGLFEGESGYQQPGYQQQSGMHQHTQGGVGGAGDPPPGGQTCIMCQRTPVNPVTSLCIRCQHIRDNVAGSAPRCSVP